MMPGYETFAHEADIGIRGFGSTEAEAFEQTARALYSVMVDIQNVLPVESRIVSVTAPDLEQLLVEWLNALLAVSDIDRMVFSRFEVSIRGASLQGTAWGEALDRSRHDPQVEVKGATYHQVRVEEATGGFIAQCVVDV